MSNRKKFKDRQKGDRCRPVVTVLKAKGGKPNIILVGGLKYIVQPSNAR